MNRARLTLVVVCLAYYATLSISYAMVESRLFDLIGLEYYPPSLTFQFLAATMATLSSFWLPTIVRHPSQVCSWILYVTIVVPMMFIPFHVLRGSEREIFMLPCSIFLLFGVLQVSLKMPLIRLPGIRVNREAVYWVLQIGLVALTLVVVLLDGSFRLNLSFDDIYTRRLDARDDVGSGSLTAYAITMLSYALAPTALLLGFTRRHYAVAGMALFSFLCLYSYRATKTDLFMPVYLIGICILLRIKSFPFSLTIVSAALLAVLVSMSEVLVLNTANISGYLIRRQLMVPSLLTSYYWDFFSDQPFVYFTDKFYGSYFLAPQYNLPLARLIGYEYFGNAEINANTCFWASAYANLGYPGMLLFTLLLAVVLRVMDSVADDGETVTACTMAGLFGMQLSNGSLENCMITGGVAVSFLLLFFLRTSDRHIRLQPGRRTSLAGRKEIARSWTP